jgi:hypothetical protein
MKHTHRPRQTPEQIQSLVTQFHQSELSSAAFCKKHGIAYSSFYKWCKKCPIKTRLMLLKRQLGMAAEKKTFTPP